MEGRERRDESPACRRQRLPMTVAAGGISPSGTGASRMPEFRRSRAAHTACGVWGKARLAAFQVPAAGGGGGTRMRAGRHLGCLLSSLARNGNHDARARRNRRLLMTQKGMLWRL